jgi:GTPase SAR1 family protein
VPILLQRFKSLRTPFYRGADCCMLCYDVTDLPSFKNLGMWKKEFTHYADVRDSTKFPFILLGNKVDCSAGDRAVPRDAAESWCSENGGIPYYETSAKVSALSNLLPNPSTHIHKHHTTAHTTAYSCSIVAV